MEKREIPVDTCDRTDVSGMDAHGTRIDGFGFVVAWLGLFVTELAVHGGLDQGLAVPLRWSIASFLGLALLGVGIAIAAYLVRLSS